MWNLLSNALKFTPRHGGVNVLLRRVGSNAEIEVADTGEGIRADFLPYVFDRFRQGDASTTRRHGGIGLGLAIVKQLVELHGGTIQAASDGEGKGARFVVRMPVTPITPKAFPQPADLAALVDSSAKAADLQGVRIVVIDDEADARFLVKRLLADRGASVHATASVPEAVALVQEGRCDVLVSDIGMPDEDGFSLIRQVRSLKPDTRATVPAVALTAYVRPEDRSQVLAAGFEMHVAKPVEPDHLIAAVAHLAGRSPANG